MDLTPLTDDRLVFVTGKGGTGKTTVAAAVAVLEATKGRRTLLAEVDSQFPALGPVFGKEPGFEPVNVAPNLDVCNLVWPASLVAYLRSMIPLGPVVKAILDNEMVRRFLDFVPGSQELVTVSVIVDLLEKYDVVVVDMPASGHAFSMLDITRSAQGLFRGGPIRARVEVLRRVIEDARTRMILVALPEEMVVNETLETLGRLRRFDLLGAKPFVVLNRAIPPSLTPGETELLQRLSSEQLGDDAEEFLAAGRWDLSLEEAAEQARGRLTDGLGEAPVLVAPVGGAEDERATVRGVAVQLGRRMGVSKQELTWT